MLFHKNKKPKTDLTQSEREAIVDLLHFCLYADAHISLRESAVIADVVEVIGWDAKLSFSSYEPRSIASARSAKADEKMKKEFFEYAAERLPSKGAKELALTLCGDLLSSDGTEPKEAIVLSQISAALKS